MAIIYSLVSVFIVSLMSLVGVVFLSMKIEKLKRILFFLISLATGGLFGGAFFHLLPEAYEEISNKLLVSFLVLFGIMIFLFLEKILHWRHCHVPTCKEHPHTLGYMNLISDGFHNLMDGIVIAASYFVSIPLGIAATLAVVLHEIPQEIGDFGVLIYAGFKRRKAIFLNFLSALAALLGAVLVFIFGGLLADYLQYILPIAAGGFIYIAGSDLIPEIKKEVTLKKSSIQIFGIVLGIVLMYGLVLFE
jgi:zinc and cadmium transporter